MERKGAELVKTIIICILLVALVCLCAVYLFGFEKTSSPEFSEEDLYSLRVHSVKYAYSEMFSGELVLPSFIGICSDGEKLGMRCDSEYSELAALYGGVSEYFPYLLGEGASRRTIGRAEADELLLNILEGDYIYLSYGGELPRSVIYYMTFPERIDEDIPDEYLRELFIYPTGDSVEIWSGGSEAEYAYSFAALGINVSGEYFVYSSNVVPQRPGDMCFSKKKLETYNMAGAGSFSFACETERAQKVVSFYGTQIIVSEVLSRGAGFSVPVPDFSVGTVPRAVNAFTLNFEKAAQYTGENGLHMFIEEGQNVSVLSDGTIIYSTTGDGGASLGDIFSVAGGGYTVCDYVGSSLLLLDKIGLDAGDASLALGRVTRENDRIVVTFEYRFENVPVALDGNRDAARFEYSAGKLVYAKVRQVKVSKSGRYEYIPQKWNMDLYLIGDGTKCIFNLAYYIGEDYDGGITYAEWVAEKTAGGAR